MSTSPLRPLVLVDRDGTLNAEVHYLRAPEDVVVLPHVASALRRLRSAGLPVVVITNQSAVARGYMTEDDVKAVHDRLSERLADDEAGLDGFYYCPHLPEAGCRCRKPGIALAERAAEDWNADLGRSFVVGDKACDIQLGRNIGATTVLVRTGYGAALERAGYTADAVVDGMDDAATYILAKLREESGLGLPGHV